MIYLHVTVDVVPGKVDEFHKFWSETSLPMWEKYGAKHIGSWTTAIGKGNEITRLFAFDNMAHFEKFQMFLFKDEEGRKLQNEIFKYLTGTNLKFILPASYSPLK